MDTMKNLQIKQLTPGPRFRSSVCLQFQSIRLRPMVHIPETQLQQHQIHISKCSQNTSPAIYHLFPGPVVLPPIGHYARAKVYSATKWILQPAGLGTPAPVPLSDSRTKNAMPWVRNNCSACTSSLKRCINSVHALPLILSISVSHSVPLAVTGASSQSRPASKHLLQEGWQWQ